MARSGGDPIQVGLLKSLITGIGWRYRGSRYGAAKNTGKVPALDV